MAALQAFFADNSTGPRALSDMSERPETNFGSAYEYDSESEDEDMLPAWKVAEMQRTALNEKEKTAFLRMNQVTPFPVFRWPQMEKAYGKYGMSAPAPMRQSVNTANCVTKSATTSDRSAGPNKFLKTLLYNQYLARDMEVLQLGGETSTDFLQMDAIGVTRVYIVGHCNDCLEETQQLYKSLKLERKIKINCVFMTGLKDRWNWQGMFEENMFDAVVFPFSFNRCVTNDADAAEMRKILEKYVVDDGVVIITGERDVEEPRGASTLVTKLKNGKIFPNESSVSSFDPFSFLRQCGWDGVVRGDGSTVARSCDKKVVDASKGVVNGMALPTVARKLESTFAAVYMRPPDITDVVSSDEVVQQVSDLTATWEDADTLLVNEVMEDVVLLKPEKPDDEMMEMQKVVEELELPRGAPNANGILVTENITRDMHEDAFVVKPKADGFRSLAVLHKANIMFVDRKGEKEYVKTKSRWKETMILDGERMGDIFRIFDVYYSDRNVSTRNLLGRLKCLQVDEIDRGRLAAYGFIRPTFRKISSSGITQCVTSKYDHDGLVFVPAAMPVEHVKKKWTYYWKALVDRSVDVRISETATSLENVLPTKSGGQPFGPDVVEIGGVEWTCENTKVKKEVITAVKERELEGKILEIPANVDAFARHGPIIRVRYDKDWPNSAYTAMKITMNHDLPTVHHLIMSLQETPLRGKKRPRGDSVEVIGEYKLPKIAQDDYGDVQEMEIDDELAGVMKHGFTLDRDM